VIENDKNSLRLPGASVKNSNPEYWRAVLCLSFGGLRGLYLNISEVQCYTEDKLRNLM